MSSQLVLLQSDSVSSLSDDESWLHLNLRPDSVSGEPKATAKIRARGWWDRTWQRFQMFWQQVPKCWSTPQTERENQAKIESDRKRLINDVVGLLTLKTQSTRSGARVVASTENKGTKKEWRLNVKLGLDKMERAGRNVFDGREESRAFVREVVERLQQDSSFQDGSGRFDLLEALDQIDRAEQAHTAWGWTSTGFGRPTGRARKFKLVELIRNALVADAFAKDKACLLHQQRSGVAAAPNTDATAWQSVEGIHNDSDICNFLHDNLMLYYEEAQTTDQHNNVAQFVREILSAAERSQYESDLFYLEMSLKALNDVVGHDEVQNAIEAELCKTPLVCWPARLIACDRLGIGTKSFQWQIITLCTNESEARQLFVNLMQTASEMSRAGGKIRRSLANVTESLHQAYPKVVQQEFANALLKMRTEDTRGLCSFLNACDNLRVHGPLAAEAVGAVANEQENLCNLMQILIRSVVRHKQGNYFRNSLIEIANKHKDQAELAFAQEFCDTVHNRPAELGHFLRMCRRNGYDSEYVTHALLNSEVVGEDDKEKTMMLLQAAAALGLKKGGSASKFLAAAMMGLREQAQEQWQTVIDDVLQEGLSKQPANLPMLFIARQQLLQGGLKVESRLIIDSQGDAEKALLGFIRGAGHPDSMAPPDAMFKPVEMIAAHIDDLETHYKGISYKVLKTELHRILEKDRDSLPQFLDACDRLGWSGRLHRPLAEILQGWEQKDVGEFLSAQRTEADTMRQDTNPNSSPDHQFATSIFTVSPSRWRVIVTTREINFGKIFDGQEKDYQFQDGMLDGKLTQPGRGNINRPFYGKFKGDLHPKTGYVLKKDQTESHQRSLGNDRHASAETENILFCSKFGKIIEGKMKELGRTDAYNLAGDTYLGKLPGHTETNFVTVTERFTGETMSKWYRIPRTFEEIRNRREFMGMMRLFDFATGQTDRNGGNAIFSSSTCHLIDNGACMGSAPLPATGFDLQSPDSTITFTRFERQLLDKLSERDIDRAAFGLGLSDISVTLAKQRLNRLKQMSQEEARHVDSRKAFALNFLRQCDDMAQAAQISKLGSFELQKYRAARMRVNAAMIFSPQNREQEGWVRQFAVAARRLNFAFAFESARNQLAPNVKYELYALAAGLNRHNDIW